MRGKFYAEIIFNGTMWVSFSMIYFSLPQSAPPTAPSSEGAKVINQFPYNLPCLKGGGLPIGKTEGYSKFHAAIKLYTVGVDAYIHPFV